MNELNIERGYYHERSKKPVRQWNRLLLPMALWLTVAAALMAMVAYREVNRTADEVRMNMALAANEAYTLSH